MTHQGFKDILNGTMVFSLEFINQFLDGKNQDPILLAWFNLWKTGHYKQIFDEIDQMENLILQTKANQTPPNASFIVPIDFDVPRRESNKNV